MEPVVTSSGLASSHLAAGLRYSSRSLMRREEGEASSDFANGYSRGLHDDGELRLLDVKSLGPRRVATRCSNWSLMRVGEERRNRSW